MTLKISEQIKKIAEKPQTSGVTRKNTQYSLGSNEKNNFGFN
jgi:hypothetical protein